MSLNGLLVPNSFKNKLYNGDEIIQSNGGSIPEDIFCNSLTASNAITSNGSLTVDGLGSIYELEVPNTLLIGQNLTVNGTTNLGQTTFLTNTIHNGLFNTYNASNIDVINGSIAVRTTGGGGGGGNINVRFLELSRTIAPFTLRTTRIEASELQVPLLIEYKLPIDYPTTNGQVLTSQTNGLLSWVSPSIPPNLPAYENKFTNIDTLLTSLSPTHTIPYSPSFLLNVGSTYRATATFSFRKEAGTTFSLYCRLIPISGATIKTTAMGTNSTAIVDVSNSPPNNSQNFQHSFWFTVSNANTSWEIQAESGAQGGGQVRWDIVEFVFEPSLTLIEQN